MHVTQFPIILPDILGENVYMFTAHASSSPEQIRHSHNYRAQTREFSTHVIAGQGVIVPPCKHTDHFDAVPSVMNNPVAEKPSRAGGSHLSEAKGVNQRAEAKSAPLPNFLGCLTKPPRRSYAPFLN
jgi:hypothetical protein